jgi:hypothetical protein
MTISQLQQQGQPTGETEPQAAPEAASTQASGEAGKPAGHIPTHTLQDPSAQTKPQHPQDAPGGMAKSMAHWIHAHPEAHSRTLLGRLVYQFTRSFVASIPYGLSMAGVLAGLYGSQKMGEKMAGNTQATSLWRGIGRNIAGFASFGPAKSALLIGTSFTLYRGTSKLGKWMTEYLFNPKDTEARTAEKVQDLPQEAWRKIKEIAPAESSSTPISAIVLGFIVNAFNKPTQEVNGQKVIPGKVWGKAVENLDWTRANFLGTKGWGNKARLLFGSLTPQTKFVQHAVINTFAYSLFFELGDRLFKDTQIRRNVWPGEHNSIKALKAAPEEYERGIQQQEAAANQPKYEDSAAEAAPEKNHYKFFTSEPGVGRFLFRRVLPTAVGMTAYTALKMRWGTMLGNNFVYDKGVSLAQFGKKAWGEGLATSLFFLIPIVSEPWEKLYDNFFARKEKIAQLKDRMKDNPEIYARPLTAEQHANYEALYARVNAQEKAANEGKFAARA